jgi:Secretion system C-terminal sorting domain
MKKISLLLLLALLSTNAQDWEVVGQQGFSDDVASDITLKINNENIPYVCFVDHTDFKTVVMKLEGETWQSVGPYGLTEGSSTLPWPSFAISNSDVPYVAFKDASHNNKLTVMSFNGTSWEILGTPGFTATIVDNNSSLAVDSNGVPYVCYEDIYHQTTVMKFISNQWQSVGAEPFTEETSFPKIALDNNDIPYIAFRDNTDKVTVKKFENDTWQSVGLVSFSTGIPYVATLDFESNNIPYVAYIDLFPEDNDATKSSIIKFENNSWQLVGPQYFAPGLSESLSFTLDANDVPYVTFNDFSNEFKASVMKFNGNSWEYVGAPGFSLTNSDYTSIGIDSNGIIYVAFMDWGWPAVGKITVMKYDPTTAADTQDLTNITLYPNPADNEVTIANFHATATLTVTDMTGKVLHQLTNQDQTTLNTSGFANGIYLVEITTVNESTIKKLVVNRQ